MSDLQNFALVLSNEVLDQEGSTVLYIICYLTLFCLNYLKIVIVQCNNFLCLSISAAGEESEKEEEALTSEWWGDYVSDKDKYNHELSGKLVLLAEILRMCENIGDKV